MLLDNLQAPQPITIWVAFVAIIYINRLLHVFKLDKRWPMLPLDRSIPFIQGNFV